MLEQIEEIDCDFFGETFLHIEALREMHERNKATSYNNYALG